VFPTPHRPKPTWLAGPLVDLDGAGVSAESGFLQTEGRMARSVDTVLDEALELIETLTKVSLSRL
jgi:hypothetical protein